MKRVLLILVLLAAVAVAAWFALNRRGVTEGAQLVPATTVLYAALPDVARTADRWPKTALGRIAAEPGVAAFLEQPSRVLAEQGGIEGLDFLLRVKPGRFFVAVTAINESGGDIVLGFEYHGSRKDVDAAMDRLHRELAKNFPDAQKNTATYQGTTVTSFGSGAALLHSATDGKWGFLSNSQKALEQALDRSAGRDKTAPLADDETFKTVLARLARDPDLAWFVRPGPMFDTLFAVAGPDAGITPEQRLEIAKLKAAGGTLQFDGADQREATFLLYPDSPKLPAVDRGPMAFTTPTTTFYSDSSLDWGTISSEAYLRSLSPEMQTFLGAAKIDLKTLPAIFGDDLGVVVNWPENAMIPTALVSLEVKDRAAAEGLIDNLVSQTGLPVTNSEMHGARVVGFPSAQLQVVDPVLAVNDRTLLLSLTSAEAERVLTGSGGPTLESAEAFKPALAAFRGDSQAFAFLDTRAVFEKIYNQVRPIAIFAAAMSPDLSKVVDVQKLPETESISKHLGPVIYTTRQVEDGWLLESSGPITLSQAFVVGVGAGAAAFASQFAAGE